MIGATASTIAGRGTLAASLLALLLGLGGCCGAPAPRAEKFFDRSTPAETVRMIRYAVEARQWGVVYDSMTDVWREENSETAMALAIRFGWFEGRSVEDWIVNANQDEGWVEFYPGDPTRDYASVIVTVFEDPDDLDSPYWRQGLWLERENGEWHLALGKDPAEFLRDAAHFPTGSPLQGAVGGPARAAVAALPPER